MSEKQLITNSGDPLGWNPLVSVIIPAYNADKYIGRTVKSVISQTYSNIEVIVVDDGSTDRTSDCVRSLSKRDSRVILVSQENKGVSAARNKGLLVARGDFVVFVDADDLLAPNCLEEAIAKAAENTDVDCVFWRYDLVDEEGNHISKNSLDKTAKKTIRNIHEMEGCRALELMLKKEIWIWTGSVMFNRQMLLDIGLIYTVGCTHGEDQEFILRCLSNSRRVVAVNEVLSHYTQRSDSVVRAANLNLFHEVGAYRRLMCYFARTPKRRKITKHIEEQILPERYVAVIRNLSVRGFPKHALKRIAMHSFFRSCVKNYKSPERLSAKSLAVALFRVSPTLFVSLFSFIGDLKRIVKKKHL